MHNLKISQTSIARPVVRSPAARAAFTAAIYLVICAAYIVMSGRWAAESVATPLELQEIETFKGVAFVVVTAVGFYLISLARWRRIRNQEEIIIAQQEALVRNEQRSATALYSAALAHDLGNLLFAVQGLLDKIEESESKESFPGPLRNDLEQAISGLGALSQRLTASAREAIPDDVSDVDARETVDRLARLARHHPELRRTSINAVDIPEARLRLNESMFEDALLNLVINAGQAAGPDGRVEIRMHETDDTLRLEVHDDGPGVPEDENERIFVPLYTTKPDGTGLGLLSVRALAATCGGHVDVGRSNLGGAVFTLTLPRDASPAVA